MIQQEIFPIGTQYKTRGKHPRLCKVIDIHKTYNHAGELVKIRYVSIHEFCGQAVHNYDVVAAAIAIGYVGEI